MHAPSLLQGAFVLAATVTAVTARALPGATVLKRHPVGQDGDCSVQPAGSGPSPPTDTSDAFQGYPAFANAANGAVTPSGYDVVAVNQLSTVQHDAAYISYEEISSYDVSYCAAQCDSRWPGCTSFNIYFERDPIQDSAPACPNPASTTRIKCAYFSSCSTTDELTNDGQYCYEFHVVMAGSNTYNKKGGCNAPTTTTTTVASTTPVTTTAKISTTPSVSTTPVISTTPVVPTTSKAPTTKASTTAVSTTRGWGNWPSTTGKASTTAPFTTKATTPATTPSTTKPTTPATTPATTKPTTLITTTKFTTPATTPSTTKPAVPTTPATTPATTKPAAVTTTSCNKGAPTPPSQGPQGPQPPQNQQWNNWNNGNNGYHW